MKMVTHEHDDDDQPEDPTNSLFRSFTFPRYYPKFHPTSHTRYIPATPRAYVVINCSGATPSNSDEVSSCISSPSLSGASSFFFTISSSSSPSSSSPPHFRSHYRCTFRGREAIGFRRMVPPDVIVSGAGRLKRHLSAISALHHANVVQLIGASVSEIRESCTTLDLVYQFVPGLTLSHCLNSSGYMTAGADTNDPYRYVSTWKSRMEIALGVASGLVYIHHMTGFDIVFVHNRIKSSNIILTSTSSGNSQLIRAKICNFGLSRDGWHDVDNNNGDDNLGEHQRLMEENEAEEEGYPYMAPELRREGIATQKSDVYAFGVLLLELLSGARPEGAQREAQASIIETSAMIFGGELQVEVEEIEKRVRLWVDKRLNDSFPVKSTVELLRVALMCVVEDPESRPDMASVEGFLFQCIRSFRTQSFSSGGGVLSAWPSFRSSR